jgi:hypothetical protein
MIVVVTQAKTSWAYKTVRPPNKHLFC